MAALVRRIYLVLIPLLVGLMFLHNVLDLRLKVRRRRENVPGAAPSVEEPRAMYLNERIQHLLLAISFLMLIVTGFALKFPEAFWARPIVTWESRWPLRAWLHRAAAGVLIGTAFYHVIYLGVSRPGRRHWMQLWPRRRDLGEILGAIRQYLGGSLVRLSTYNYIQKAEYWALVWGTVVMAATGFVLWFNDFSLRYLPRWAIDLATTIHYYEAILAGLAVLVWHCYWVIFDPDHYPMDWLWWTGTSEAHGKQVEVPAE